MFQFSELLRLRGIETLYGDGQSALIRLNRDPGGSFHYRATKNHYFMDNQHKSWVSFKRIHVLCNAACHRYYWCKATKFSPMSISQKYFIPMGVHKNWCQSCTKVFLVRHHS